MKIAYSHKGLNYKNKFATPVNLMGINPYKKFFSTLGGFTSINKSKMFATHAKSRDNYQ